jgi:hypothetical protein
MKKFVIIIPAYNEAGRISSTIAGIRKITDADILVVDDGQRITRRMRPGRQAQWCWHCRSISATGSAGPVQIRAQEGICVSGQMMPTASMTFLYPSAARGCPFG